MTILIKRDDRETRLESKTRNRIAWLLTLVFAFFLTSCSSSTDEPEQVAQPDTYINMLVSTPTTTANSNSGQSSSLQDDQVAANPTEEEKIYSIRVWAYANGSGDNATPIGYTEKTNITDATGTTSVGMKILRRFAENTEKMDLYILINAESIGKATILNGTSNNAVTRGTLASIQIDGDNFGITSDGKPSCQKVPATGLPISRVVTNINVSDYVKPNEQAAAEHPININLVRAVSKLHFYFARKADAGTDFVQITRIVLNENILPTASPVFPIADQYTENEATNKDIHGTYGSSVSYINKTVTLDGVATEGIKEVKTPTDYIKKTDESASAYVTRLATAGITEHDRCYFRESNNPISGKIYYKLADGLEEHSEEFCIPGKDNPAYRNHDLLVYGHFEEGTETTILEIKYYVASWTEKTPTNITFE